MRVFVFCLALLIAAPVSAREPPPRGFGIGLLIAGISIFLGGVAVLTHTLYERDHTASAPTLGEFQQRSDAASYAVLSAPLILIGTVASVAGSVVVARPRPARRIEAGLTGLRVHF